MNVLGLAALIVTVYFGYRSDQGLKLARWTAKKDLKEACMDDKQLGIPLSQICRDALSSPTQAAPIVRRSLEGGKAVPLYLVGLLYQWFLIDRPAMAASFTMVITSAIGIVTAIYFRPRRHIFRPIVSMARECPVEREPPEPPFDPVSIPWIEDTGSDDEKPAILHPIDEDTQSDTNHSVVEQEIKKEVSSTSLLAKSRFDRSKSRASSVNDANIFDERSGRFDVDKYYGTLPAYQRYPDEGVHLYENRGIHLWSQQELERKLDSHQELVEDLRKRHYVCASAWSPMQSANAAQIILNDNSPSMEEHWHDVKTVISNLKMAFQGMGEMPGKLFTLSDADKLMSARHPIEVTPIPYEDAGWTLTDLTRIYKDQIKPGFVKSIFTSSRPKTWKMVIYVLTDANWVSHPSAGSHKSSARSLDSAISKLHTYLPPPLEKEDHRQFCIKFIHFGDKAEGAERLQKYLRTSSHDYGGIDVNFVSADAEPAHMLNPYGC